MTNNKEITFCFESFYPSNLPYCHILKDMIEESCNKGLSVKVITPHKKNPQEQKLMNDFFIEKEIEPILFKFSKNLTITRLLFPLFVFTHLLFKSRGVVVTPSTPPVLMGFITFLAKRLSFSRFEYVYHCQDLHPEALEISGLISNKIIISFLTFLDKITIKNAKENIVLSQDMKNTLVHRTEVNPNNISVINNFIPSAYTNNKKTLTKTIRASHSKNDLIFVFAGNLGAFQNLEMLLLAFLNLDKRYKAFLYFIGDGKEKENLMSILANHQSEMKSNIFFLNKVNSDKITNYIESADYGIVSLSDGLLDVAYPSKIATYLNLGLPVLLCGGKNSDLCKEIKKHHLGVSINGDDINSILEGIEIAITRKNYFSNKHNSITRYFQKKYNKKKIINTLIEAIIK